MFKATAALALILLGKLAIAEEFSGPYNGYDIRVIDGDTLEANIQVWPDVIMNVSVRLRGIDAPELRGNRCESADYYASLAKLELEKRFARQSAVELRNVKQGAFAGRVIADVWRPNVQRASDIVNQLLRKNYVLPWTSEQEKEDWCAYFATMPKKVDD